MEKAGTLWYNNKQIRFRLDGDGSVENLGVQSSYPLLGRMLLKVPFVYSQNFSVKHMGNSS